MKGAGRIRTPGSEAVKLQSGRRAAAQSVVGLAAAVSGGDTAIPVGVGVAVGVGVKVEAVVGKGVTVGAGVEVSGSRVQVGGRTTFVPVGGGVLLGGGASSSRGAQPVKAAASRAIENQPVNPGKTRKSAAFRNLVNMEAPISHPDLHAVQPLGTV